MVGLDYVGGIVGYLQGRNLANAIVDCTVASGTVISSSGKYGNIRGGGVFLEEPALWDGYYEIYTADQLKWFRNKVNGGSTTIKARLMSDINMSKAGGFTPIGTEDNPFAGVFDGQENTIDSLTINDQKYAGFFGYVKDGSIKNLTLHHPKLTTIDNDYLGLVAGFLTQNEGHATPVGYIENCHVQKGELLRGGDGSPDYVGGIVGKVDMSAEVRDCTFQGTVKAHENRIGGIAGYMDSGAKLYRCSTLDGSIVWGNNYVGGVVGYMTDESTLIDMS